MKEPHKHLNSISVYFNRVPADVTEAIIESKFMEIQKQVNAIEEPDLFNFV